MFDVSNAVFFNSLKQIKYHSLILCFILFFIQKSAATTFYINDNNIKGDIYTTAIGNDTNSGTSSTSPKLTVKSAYENAQNGDTIIIDTGVYSDLSSKGEFLFPITKKIKFIIAGVSDTVFSKTPLTKEMNASPAHFYVDKDKPIDRGAYLQRLQDDVKKKLQ